MGTPLLVKPTLEEVRLQAAKIGLPDLEAQKFFYYFESNGWKVGRNKMVSVNGALAHWKLVWMERNMSRPPEPPNGKQRRIDQRIDTRTLFQKELDAITKAPRP